MAVNQYDKTNAITKGDLLKILSGLEDTDFVHFWYQTPEGYGPIALFETGHTDISHDHEPFKAYAIMLRQYKKNDD